LFFNNQPTLAVANFGWRRPIIKHQAPNKSQITITKHKFAILKIEYYLLFGIWKLKKGGSNRFNDDCPARNSTLFNRLPVAASFTVRQAISAGGADADGVALALSQTGGPTQVLQMVFSLIFGGQAS
jgi:hypothetical protein